MFSPLWWIFTWNFITFGQLTLVIYFWKQFRTHQNDLACLKNVKKTALSLAIFCFSSFDTSWNWHFPDILANIFFSLTQHKIPWQFPDLEKF